MPLEIAIKCDGCRKEFSSEEIYRIAEIHRALTRVSRRVMIELPCIKCGRKVRSRSFRKDYICPQCMIQEEKIKNPPKKGGREKGSKNKKKEEQNKQEPKKKILTKRCLFSGCDVKYTTESRVRKYCDEHLSTGKKTQSSWEDEDIEKEIEDENIKYRQEGY